MMRNLLLTSLLAFGVAQSSVLFFVPKGSSSDLQCPDGSPCPDESTCCKLQSGHYGCCPQKNGVCCADQLHCCPNSFTCDLQHGTCVNAQSGESFGFEDVKIHGNTDHQPSKQAAPKKDDVDRNQCLDGLRCDDDQTCCPIGRGEYACCMFDQGVCCSDEVHCCPHGQKCDVQHEECVGDSFSVPWNDYARLRNMTKVRNVRCPDGSTCSGSSTCCPMGSSTYGCCPYQEAVCCSDKQHCCPHGFQCDVTHGQCKKGFVAMSWGTPEVSDVVCPDGSSCPGGSTCCELASGQYGCCPLPNAVCCDDKEHCCPQGYTCDVAESKCNKGLLSVSWSSHRPSSAKAAVTCPDGSSCPDQTTCCELASGQYGCCPLPDAVCCEDKEHCCPQGYTCDVAESKCNKGLLSMSWSSHRPSAVKAAVTCPDGSSCPDENTCCELPSGQYGCCPLPNAVCCDDKEHCCPQGYTCDVAESKCNKGLLSVSWSSHRPLSVKAAVTCPDGSSCPDQTTCCELASGQYGCCPLPDAVCCDDKEHCCPQGYTCDVAESKCNKGLLSVSWSSHRPLSVKAAVTCPDGSSCPDENTCCELASRQYACCPLPDAVCCDDKEHCCPQGYTCDVAESKCNKGLLSMSWSSHRPSSVKAAVTCPDGSSCPDQSTCCELASGQYGCCPLPNAVCCDDKEHCCPQGYTCDTAESKCNKGLISVSWSSHSASSVKDVVTCPDGSSCPDENTCCEVASGQYGCCPLPNAVCCDDKEHCCPQGYTCDTAESKCNKGLISVSWSSHSASSVKAAVTCPDGSSCPDQTTCCELASGQYGCCPLPNAVCCDDKEHCCPQGYTCDTAESKCNKGLISVSWSSHSASSAKAAVTCPDGSSCPDQTTCCELASGQYGCCPLPNAVCCDDKEHCCPQGYTCDVAESKCNKGLLSMSWSSHRPSSVKAAVTCPDGSSCPDQSTCCELASGQYGCCPLPNAVCCDDKEHCCPQGYTCDTAESKCNKGLISVSWSSHSASSVKAAVTCPDGSSCPDQTTCCELASGQYGCCPLPDAVCCDDKEHCCPQGYTCDVAESKCNKGLLSMSWSSHRLSSVKAAVTCPDGSSCPDQSTCCELASGQYGCCPLPNAVCCDDKEHCCPQGYTCDVAESKCNKGLLSVSWSSHKRSAVKTVGVTCPNSFSCPDQNTCCQLASGKYACCPYENAVCCDDKKHCCPQGYTCDVAAGRCNRGLVSVAWSSPKPSVPKVHDVECPDGSTCDEENTCCELASSDYGCCPYPNAICCSDKEHCCPEGYTCDVPHQQCNKDSVSVPWSSSRRSSVKAAGVECPDGSSCPDETTCCQLVSGEYGCCPKPNAVCCSDKQHCCPHGYTCDTAHQRCTHGPLISVPWNSPTRSVSKVRDVKCADGSSCADGNTCCELPGTVYGCCPFADAVCCSDKLHCCRAGFKCDVQERKCIKGSLSVPWSSPSVSKKHVTQADSSNVQCPDGSSCSDGNTCCQLGSGQYGCCPYSDAVCCSDKAHCCPNGHKCNLVTQTCDQGTLSLTWSAPLPAVRVPRDIDCPGEKQTCPDENTCCEYESGGYGCCPLPEAVCCSDKKHCCKKGTRCNLEHMSCDSDTESLSWMATPKPNIKEVEAKPTCQCPASGTCCQSENSINGFECCPYKDAICCANGQHCCPAESTCDATTQMCRSTTSSLAISWRKTLRLSAVLAQLAQVPTKEVCPDQSFCDSGTCCSMQSGRFACCPYEKAVCCPDMIHCCPTGYSCNLEMQLCERNGKLQLPWEMFTRRRARPAASATMP